MSERDPAHRRDTVVTAATSFAVYALGILTGPLLARALGAADRGSFAAAWTTTTALSYLLMLGLPLATAYHATDHDRRDLLDAVWVITAAVAVPVAVALGAAAPHLLARHPPAAVGWFRAFLVVAVLVVPFESVCDHLRVGGAAARAARMRALGPALAAGGIVGLAAVGRLDLGTACAATFVGHAGGMLVGLGRTAAWPRRRRPGPLPLAVQFRYGIRVWSGTVATIVLGRYDQVLMVALVEPAELGRYAVAVTAAGLSAPVAIGIAQALFGHARDGDAADRAAAAARWSCAISVAIGVVLVAVGPWALPAVMGPAFAGAVPAFLVLVPGQVCWNVGIQWKTRLEASGRPGVASGSMAGAAVLALVAVPVVVPVAGIVGAATVTTLAQATFAGTAWALARRVDGRAQTAAPAAA